MSEPNPPNQVEKKPESTKQKYVPPKLEALGSFIDLTQAEISMSADGGIDF
jgi:hypothetical protein